MTPNIDRLVSEHADRIKAAIIEYRFADYDLHYAMVDKIIDEANVELWEYIEASALIQAKEDMPLGRVHVVADTAHRSTIGVACPDRCFTDGHWFDEQEADHLGL